MAKLFNDTPAEATPPAGPQWLLSASLWIGGMACWALVLAAVFLGAELF